jgi:hypothetical protein
MLCFNAARAALISFGHLPGHSLGKLSGASGSRSKSLERDIEGNDLAAIQIQ